MTNILYATLWFTLIGGVLGILLAIASKFFAVKTDPRIEKITELLPGANCGGCGYTGCAALAEAIVKGDAKPNACHGNDESKSAQIAEIMGVTSEKAVRFRAQVMCSGTNELAIKKYVYEGIDDCVAAAKLAGGSKLCPDGCIGLGTCVRNCKFDAIHVINGVAVVDYSKCTACGACVQSCPKHLIVLIPFESAHWVGCKSTEKGGDVRKFCDVGCIGCKLCEKSCKSDAIKVGKLLAEIDYTKCIDCGECVAHCPRKIIWSSHTQKNGGLIISRETLNIQEEKI